MVVSMAVQCLYSPSIWISSISRKREKHLLFVNKLVCRFLKVVLVFLGRKTITSNPNFSINKLILLAI